VVFEKEPSRKTESEPERPTSQIETGLIAALSTERSANSPAYFRSLARLGVQVAEALDHAHQQGIVHRDIKPPNLMLDARGKAWVTDFGLAHIETNASLTMTGDLLGTVRYMSPEQALAKRIVVDHRTDIYSLGVTLYELLTLQPVFAGKDRQELLRQIAFEEPRPLRRLNKSIPAELETIVLKAMAKNPAERYATAQELADDLQRFQEDKPIRARRPTVFQRVRKWSRRHKPVVVSGVVSAMVLLVVGVAGLALSNVRVRHEQLRTNRALEKAENNYQEAQAQRRRAEENVQLALQALDEIYLKIAEQKLPDQLELNEQDQKFLEQVLPFYEKIAKQKADDPHTQLARAKAYLRVGNIYSRLRHRQTEKAEAAVRQAIAMFGELDAEFPTELEHAHYLAISQRDLGILLWETGRAKEMEATFRQAIEIYEKIAFKLPSHQSHELLNVYTRLGILLNEKLAQPNEAEQIYRQSLVLAEKLVARFPNAPALRSRVIPAQSGLARALRRTGRLQQAEQLYRQVIDSCEKSLSDSPKHSTYRFYFGSSLLELGRILRKTNRRQQAEQAYRRAKDSFEKRLADAPNERGTRFYLGLCFRSLGALLKDTNRRQEAEQAYKRALALHEEVLQQGSDQLWHRGVLTDTLYEFGSLLLATGRLTEAESHYRRSLELREQLIREFPYSSRRSEKVGNARTALAGLLIQMGRKEEAERMEIDIPPPHTMEEYVQRGRFYDQIREYEKAQADFVKAAELGSDNPMINNNAAWFSIRFPSGNPESVERAVRWANKVVELAPQKGYAWSTLGVAHYRAGDWKVAIEALEKSEEIDKGKNFSFNGFFLALAHWQLGHHDEAHKWYRKAVEWMKKNRPDDEELIGFRAEAQELFGLNIPAIAPKPEAKQKETADER
jgi:tetratricopeptide (TPR) repeat protein